MGEKRPHKPTRIEALARCSRSESQRIAPQGLPISDAESATAPGGAVEAELGELTSAPALASVFRVAASLVYADLQKYGPGRNCTGVSVETRRVVRA